MPDFTDITANCEWTRPSTLASSPCAFLSMTFLFPFQITLWYGTACRQDEVQVITQRNLGRLPNLVFTTCSEKQKHDVLFVFLCDRTSVCLLDRFIFLFFYMNSFWTVTWPVSIVTAGYICYYLSETREIDARPHATAVLGYAHGLKADLCFIRATKTRLKVTSELRHIQKASSEVLSPGGERREGRILSRAGR